MNKQGQVSSVSAVLSTYCSRVEGVRFSKWMKSKFGFQFEVRRDSRLSAGQEYFLTANHEDTLAFCKLIEVHTPSCMLKKLENYHQFVSGENLPEIGRCKDCKVVLYDLRRKGLCAACYYKNNNDDSTRQTKAKRHAAANKRYISKIEKKIPNGFSIFFNMHTVRISTKESSIHLRARLLNSVATITIVHPPTKISQISSSLNLNFELKFKKQFGSNVAVIYDIDSSVLLKLLNLLALEEI